MISYDGFCGTAAMLGGGGRWQMPFYIGCSGDERHVVQIDNLTPIVKESSFVRTRLPTFNRNSNFGYAQISLNDSNLWEG